MPKHESKNFNICDIDFNYWNISSDFLSIFKAIKVPNYLLVSCSNQPLIRMWSIFGDLVCVTNLEHPLPYRWRHKMENKTKRETKLHNSLRIIKEVKKRYPSFKQAKFSITYDQTESDQTKVTTFAKLLRDIELEDKEQN